VYAKIELQKILLFGRKMANFGVLFKLILAE